MIARANTPTVNSFEPKNSALSIDEPLNVRRDTRQDPRCIPALATHLRPDSRDEVWSAVAQDGPKIDDRYRAGPEDDPLAGWQDPPDVQMGRGRSANFSHGFPRALGGLRKGFDDIKDTGPIRHVMLEQFAAILPFISKPIRAMIELPDLTGMRPGEVTALRTGQLDRSGETWEHRLSRHKTMNKGFVRLFPIDPRAKVI